MSKFIGLVVAFTLLIAITFALKMTYVMEGVVLAVFYVFAIGTGYVLSKQWFKKLIMWGPIAFVVDLVLSWIIALQQGYTLIGWVSGITFGILVSLVIKYEQIRLYPEKHLK